MNNRTSSALLVVGGGALMAVSVYIPWVEIRAPFHQIDRAAYNGLETGDGWVAIAVGILAGLLGILAIRLVTLPSLLLGLGALVGAAAGAWVAWTNFDDIPRFQAEVAFRWEGEAYGVMGPGLWALAAGAGIAVVGSILLASSGAPEPSPERSTVAPPPPIPPPPWTGPAGAIVSQPAEREPASLCVNGHPMQPGDRSCPSCGAAPWD